MRSARLDLTPLGEYLAERMPPRTHPPGTIRRYNDHKLALAGYLVEVVSGMPYEQYVRERIFGPLEMHDTSILLPADQLSRADRGYPVGGGPEDAYPLSYYYLNDAPVTSINTTAVDMTRYMMAHLANGRYLREDGTEIRILEAETAQTLHETAFAYHPSMPGEANSFDEEFHNEQRYLRKDGGAPGMRNRMLLLMDKGLGFYLHTNTDGTGMLRNWTDAILDL